MQTTPPSHPAIPQYNPNKSIQTWNTETGFTAIYVLTILSELLDTSSLPFFPLLRYKPGFALSLLSSLCSQWVFWFSQDGSHRRGVT